jgi:hypothetical protein
MKLKKYLIPCKYPHKFLHGMIPNIKIKNNVRIIPNDPVFRYINFFNRSVFFKKDLNDGGWQRFGRIKQRK